MTTYYVERRRTRNQHAIIEIEADSPEEARELVKAQADPTDDQWTDDFYESWVDRAVENEDDLGYT